MLILAFYFTSAILFSCEEPDPVRNQPYEEDDIPEEDITEEIIIEEDYLPLKDGAKWEYLVEGIATFFDEPRPMDTLTIWISGDSIYNGETYKIVKTSEIPHYYYPYYVGKLLRKEGSEYFGTYWNRFIEGGRPANKFLDDNLPVNSTWLPYPYNIEDRKVEYKIVAKNSTRTIHGIEYKDVIEVERNHFILYKNKWELNSTLTQWYAKGVGEIYAYYPYPLSKVYHDLRFTLLKYIPPNE